MRLFNIFGLLFLAGFAVSGRTGSAEPAVESGDGLRLDFSASGDLRGIAVAGEQLPFSASPSFQVMEVTAGVNAAGFVDLKCAGAKAVGDTLVIKASGERLEVTARLSPSSSGIRIRCNVKSTVRADRALVFRWIFPVAGRGWYWSGKLGEHRPVTGVERLENVVEAGVRTSRHGGLNTAEFGGVGNGSYGDRVGMGRFSPYPLASLVSKETGVGIGIDLENPVFYRLCYLRGRGLAVEFDLGLSPKTLKFPCQANLAWVVFKVDPEWGFRSAIQQYYRLFPGCFRNRVERQGIWMPFTDITSVKDYQDFGFAFHETNLKAGGKKRGKVTIADVDREIGVYSFQYVEPWDIQIAAEKGSLDYDAAVSAAYPPEPHRTQILRSVAFDPWDQWLIRVMWAPWFPTEYAISYTTNPDPDLGPGSRYAFIRHHTIDPALEAGFDGIYFDSWEFFWPFDLNYRVDHLNVADYPLCFSSSLDKPRPAVWHYASEYEMGRAVADELHTQGKLTMGNGFYRIPFTAGIMDLFGCEFEWPGKVEERDERWAYFRTMAAAKPIVVLLNRGMYSDYFTKKPYPGYDIYFREALFWGVYPSFFSPDAARNPYWRNPDAYETGRPFFRRYIPLIKEVAGAGWQPVTGAVCDKRQVRIERFGDGSSGAVYFTLRDPRGLFSGKVRVEVESRLLTSLGNPQCVEITGEKPLRVRKRRGYLYVEMKLGRGETRVLKFYRK